MTRIEMQKRISENDPSMICEALARHSGLSKSKIKQAMNQGAVWIQKPGGKMGRIRRATARVKPGDRIALYFDDDLLRRTPEHALLLKDFSRYSIWHKPAGLMTQGTRYGDHCALTRQVELFFDPRRRTYLVHRLDRETAGIVLIAHDKTSARRFSELFRNRLIEKHYQARLVGQVAPSVGHGRIDFPLDGRPASTTYHLREYDEINDISEVSVLPQTGRFHQIRRHFALMGHPVIGDPRYGKGNKNNEGMQLVACALIFDCPFGNGRIHVEIDPGDSKT